MCCSLSHVLKNVFSHDADIYSRKILLSNVTITILKGESQLRACSKLSGEKMDRSKYFKKIRAAQPAH